MKKGRMRIDAYLVSKKITSSKSRAQQLIRRGLVTVNGKMVKKTGALVRDSNHVGVSEILKFVSRGGNKLEHALDSFKINVHGLVVADVGASTGGFTDLLLKRGAKRVFAIDVSRGQLHPDLRSNPRVVNMSGTDVRKLRALSEKADLVTIDVSLLPLREVLPSAKDLVRGGGKIIALVKPQFEVESGRKGVVFSKDQRQRSVEDVIRAAEKIGLHPRGIVRSPLRGGVANKGNIEYLILFDSTPSQGRDVRYLIKELFETEE